MKLNNEQLVQTEDQAYKLTISPQLVWEFHDRNANLIDVNFLKTTNRRWKQFKVQSFC